MSHKHRYGEPRKPKSNPHDKQQKSARVPIQSSRANPTEVPEGTKNKSEEQIHVTTPAGKATWWENIRSYVTSNAIIALFTVILTGIGALQAIIFCKQLEAMRIDQRGWLTIKQQPIDWTDLHPNQTFGFTMTMENTGKTPAIRVNGNLYVDVLPINTAPDFGPHEGTHATTSAGAIPPNTPMPLPIWRIIPTSSSDNPQPKTLTDDEKTAVDNKKSWYVIWGDITYWDIFGSQHYTHFCMFGEKNRPKQSVVEKCSAYNDVDHE